MQGDERSRIMATGIAIMATMTALGFWFTVIFLYIVNTFDEGWGSAEVVLAFVISAILTAFTWAFARLAVR